MPRVRDAVTGAVASAWEFFWGIALGIVVLWAFFLLMGGVSLGDPAWLTIVMAVLAVAAVLHYIHIRRIVSSDSELSRQVHTLRERRGF